MSKELPFFKFEPAAWKFGRIQRQSDQVKVGFMDLLCKYWYDECEMSLEDAELDFGKEILKTLLENKIILTDNDANIHIKFLDEQLNDIVEKSEQASRAGKVSAKKRAEKRLTESNDRSTPVQQNPTDKRREDKKRKDKREQEFTFEQFLNIFNENRIAKSLKSNIKKLGYEEMANFNLLTQEYSLEDFDLAIKNLLNDKWVLENNQGFPKHFLRMENFNKYLNAEVKKELTLGQKLMGGVE